MIERHHLALIREVDRQGSLTAAAETLCLSQSALSHTVRRLEEQMETPVWRREGRRLHLTHAGRYLLSLAERLLPQLEHAEEVIGQIARGQHGTLRIGMECHPCYQWLLKVVDPYLSSWPGVDVDVKQRFQFGGLGALLGHEIDVLVTPDPVRRPGLLYEPVFDYEQVLVVGAGHRLADQEQVSPDDVAEETLITYPVDIERLDVYSQFLLPAQRLPRKHKTIETTDIMLQMVAAGRGVAALPRWLVREYADRLPIIPLRIGTDGIAKQIFLGIREDDRHIDYIASFTELARSPIP